MKEKKSKKKKMLCSDEEIEEESNESAKRTARPKTKLKKVTKLQPKERFEFDSNGIYMFV